jgi:hypothetical protein
MNNTAEEICPYIGLRDDAQAHMTFTSPLNCCHASESHPAPVKLMHQNTHCLGPNYKACPVFTAGKSKPFPGSLRERMRATQDYRPDRRTSVFPMVLVVLIVLVGIAYLVFGKDGLPATPLITPFPTLTPSVSVTDVSAMPPELSSPTALQTVSPESSFTPTPFPSLTPTASPTLTFTMIPTATRTSTPSRTPTNTLTVSTATIVSEHVLENPIGSVQKFLIHRVSVGENLDVLAGTYDTSVDAIIAVNHVLPRPIRAGSIVVIPIGQTAPDGLPVFEAYQVSYTSVSAEDLAFVLQVDAALLKQFNVLRDGELLYLGEWVLVPRTRGEGS